MALRIHTQAIVILFLLIRSAAYSQFSQFPANRHSFPAQDPSKKLASRLAKPLIGDDGRVYICSEKNFFAFENNGTIAWTINLNYTCSIDIAPVHGGSRKIYLVAENRVLKVNPANVKTPDSAVQEFFGPESGQIVGLAVSVSSSCVIINVQNRGLFAYRLHGQMLWSAGPVIYQHGYRQGCKKNVTECFFTSPPVIDHCEGSLYISNNQGELYSLSVRSPHFKWIRDFSSFDARVKVTAANNGLLYVTVPARAVVLALDVFTGNTLWQRSIGPLSTEDYAPAVDSNGWISLGSLDGILYSFSPTGSLKKFPDSVNPDFVIQISPVLDCSGYGVYMSQTEMEGKVVREIADYKYISALKPKRIIFTMLVPATGVTYWSETHPPGQFSNNLSLSDLQQYKLDESTLLAFMAASSVGNPLACRTTRQKYASSCSQTGAKTVSIYTGNEKTIILFLLLETVIMIVLAALVRFCCTFWKKKKLHSQGLGKFLEKRHSLRLQKKALDRNITELEEEAAADEALVKLNAMVKEREGIQRKLSTTYSLGRDGGGLSLQSKSTLPLYDWKSRSYSFQGARNESMTVFHAYSSSETSSDGEGDNGSEYGTDNEEPDVEGKGKAPMEDAHSSIAPSPASGSGSRRFANPLFIENLSINEIEVEEEDRNIGSTSMRRRRALSESS